MPNSTKYCRYGLYPDIIDPHIAKGVVNEIVKTAHKYIHKDTKQLTVLDAGSGKGEYSLELAKHFKKVVGVDPYYHAYKTSLKLLKTSKLKNIKFVNSTMEDYSTNEKFNVIVALTVIEHMENAQESFKQIFKLLKKDGIVYITAPNKYWIFEQHYGLPFLAWLPLPIANLYLQAIKGVKSYKDCSYSMGYYETKKFLDKLDAKYDFILPFDEKSPYLNCGKKQTIYNIVKNIGIKLIKSNNFFWNFSKGFIIVAKHANNPKN